MTDWRDVKEARMRLALGLMLEEIGKYECAADVLRATIACDPQLVEAHVWLGIIYEGMARYEETVGEFVEAIRIDERAARMAVSTEPEEITRIRQILNAWPVTPSPIPEEETWYPPDLPPQIREASELSEAASKHIGAGQDAEAVEALERAVRLDPVSRPYAALLAFAYVLNRQQRVVWASRSVLWEVSPGLARVVFKH
ncbi:MAG TPA: tetratricopeptide repeat protein [Pyrinomonadaceae bacterium]|jgi:tetratricopeptide (TPR) repeat protein